MQNLIWYHFLEEYNNLQMFALCNEFNTLSLEDSGLSSSTSLVQNKIPSYGYCERFLHCCKSTPLRLSIIEHLRAPFLELPRIFLDSFRFQPEKQRIYFSFRFLPGQERFLHNDLQLPKSFDRLSFLSNSLGLSLIKRNLSSGFLFTWSSSGAGLRGLVTQIFEKLIVEVITHSNGIYGRFLVQVCLGIGCTVWYAFAPGSGDHPPVTDAFARFDSYAPFFRMEHQEPGFQKMSFVESTDVSALVELSLRDEKNPFAGITIPASGPVLKAVGLGLMVAIILAVEIVPDMSNVVKI